MNANEFILNSNAYPSEKLLLYRGKCIAWAADGKDILASGDDITELIAAVDAKYPLGTEFVIGHVPIEWDGLHDPPRRGPPSWIPSGTST